MLSHTLDPCLLTKKYATCGPLKEGVPADILRSGRSANIIFRRMVHGALTPRDSRETTLTTLDVVAWPRTTAGLTSNTSTIQQAWSFS